MATRIGAYGYFFAAEVSGLSEEDKEFQSAIYDIRQQLLMLPADEVKALHHNGMSTDNGKAELEQVVRIASKAAGLPGNCVMTLRPIAQSKT